MQNVKFEELSDLEQRAVAEAMKVLDHAYEPLTDFRVGSCLITEGGELISGANFSNACYGESICAERAAVLRANVMGLVRQVRGVVILARNAGQPTKEVTAPCGSCRQVLFEVSELSGTDMKVIMCTTDRDKIMVSTIRELLPMAFGPNDLKNG